VIVLDTHTWLWWIRGDSPELPQAMREIISNSPDPIAVASVSCLEVAWLSKKGRIALPVPIEEFFLKAIDGAGLLLLPLTPTIAARSAFLPDIHKDPIDRVLIATALEHDAELATKDDTIRRYPEVRICWTG
jgi:PIN domain nuclease of toxin-antitoxin system